MLAPLAPLALAASALLAALPAEAFFILQQKILVTTRLDPIVDPGRVSGHVHSIAGGSNFDRTMSFASTQQSKCTTAGVSVDKSNYWIPQLYYYNPSDETYTLIPAAFMNAYYLPRGKNDKDIVRAFPDGLRMISGDPNRRTFDGSASNDAISFVCLDYNGNHQGDPEWDQRSSFFRHNCPNGMRAQVNFPSCWDGVNLDSPDHKSHMAFASGGPNGGGDCPASHPVHLVTLFYEFIFDVGKFPFNPAGQPTWVFANGDTTGYGLHADFVNGWPALDANGLNVLQDAIEQCNDNNGVGGNLQDCPPFRPFLDNAAANACQPENPQVNEEIGFNGPLKALPGNNPLWVGLGPKPTVPGYEEPETEFTDFKSVIPQGYTEVGCIAEGPSGRALNAASFSNANMTRGACVAWCRDRGFPLAGVEYGRECYCDVAMRNGASNTTLLSADRCGMNCADNQHETCGGPSALSLYNNAALYPAPVALPAGWTAGGCRTDVPGRALRGYSFAADNMTPALCIATCQGRGFSIAGAEWSRECYCGNQWEGGAQDTAAGQCNMMCSGDSLQVCGAGQRLTYWTRDAAAVAPSPATTSPATTSPATTSPTTTSPATTSPTTTSPATTSPTTTSPTTTSPAATTTASPTPSPSPSPTYTPPAGYIGCYSEPANGGRMFNGTTLHDHIGLTLEACVNGCRARGYAFAGAEWYQECFCGNYLDVSLPIPESRCMRPCRGNANAICGGDRALSVYETNNGTAVRYGQRPAKRDAKWRLGWDLE